MGRTQLKPFTFTPLYSHTHRTRVCCSRDLSPGYAIFPPQGAEEVLGRTRALPFQRLQLGQPSVMSWANGTTETITSSTSVGPIHPLISDQVTTPLVAAVDLVDANNRIVLDSSRSFIENKDTGKVTMLKRSNGLWQLDLDALETLDDPPSTKSDVHKRPSFHANSSSAINTHSKPSSSRPPREIVWDLHRRFGHCSCEAMCIAVDNEKNTDPTWKDAGVTASQIRRVFRKERCLECLLAKRNLDSPGNHEHHTYKPGECISCDPSGSVSPLGPKGEVLFFLFKDIATGHLYAVPSKCKNSDRIVDIAV